jgi:regulator of PEP synthase PpsR (kinase-PPPase family)
MRCWLWGARQGFVVLIVTMGTELQLGYMYCRRSIPRETVNSCPLAYLFNSPISLSFMPNRSVFFVSDGTGITAETFGKAILAQFEISPRQVRLPFMDSVDKAHQAVRQINHAAEVDGKRPIVFSTLVNMEVLAVIKETCQGMVLDMFGTFVAPLEKELNLTSNHRVGRFSDVSKSQEYHDRIEAINFSLAHDDGQSNRDLSSSDVILVGVSRSGKTPTSLYLAMQYGLKASNYPLIPEDFDRHELPPDLAPFKSKLFGLTIQPERLSEIRNERRPNSRYASLDNCRNEVHEAEAMMRREGIRWLSTTTKSIEEIATTILQVVQGDHKAY